MSVQLISSRALGLFLYRTTTVSNSSFVNNKLLGPLYSVRNITTLCKGEVWPNRQTVNFIKLKCTLIRSRQFDIYEIWYTFSKVHYIFWPLLQLLTCTHTPYKNHTKYWVSSFVSHTEGRSQAERVPEQGSEKILVFRPSKDDVTKLRRRKRNKELCEL